MRSSPNSSGQGLSDSTYSVPESFKLCPVAREFLLFRLHDVRRRVLPEALVGEHPLTALDLLAQTRPLGLEVALAVLFRTDDGHEDPVGVAHQADADAASPVDARGELRFVERAQIADVVGPRPRPGSDDQPRLPSGQVRPDLLGDV